MSEQDGAGRKPAGGTQSGGAQPLGDDIDPLHDPSAAGADLYNSGNKTGNPVTSGTPNVAERGDGQGKVKKTPVVDRS